MGPRDRNMVSVRLPCPWAAPAEAIMSVRQSSPLTPRPEVFPVLGPLGQRSLAHPHVPWEQSRERRLASACWILSRPSPWKRNVKKQNGCLSHGLVPCYISGLLFFPLLTVPPYQSPRGHQTFSVQLWAAVCPSTAPEVLSLRSPHSSQIPAVVC